jgi:hypothetical protein
MSSHSRMTHEHSARLLCTPGDGDERWDKRDHKTIARSICSAPLEQSAAANVQSAAATKQSAASQTNRIMFSRTCWTAHRGFFTTGHSARCNRPSPTLMGHAPDVTLEALFTLPSCGALGVHAAIIHSSDQATGAKNRSRDLSLTWHADHAQIVRGNSMKTAFNKQSGQSRRSRHDSWMVRSLGTANRSLQEDDCKQATWLKWSAIRQPVSRQELRSSSDNWK